MRYLLTFSYDGAKFHGFQRQKGIRNIQSTLEDTLSDLLNETIIIKGAGRTDAGVHAIAQTAHFDTTKKLKKNFIKQINKEVQDIHITKIKKVAGDFHARFSVKKKKYCYVINKNKEKRNDDYVFTAMQKLDMQKMKKASKLFIGTHDFEQFVSGKREDYQTHIYKIKVINKKDYIILSFIGAGFYRYMIRHLAGALYDVGRGKSKEEVIKKMLEKPQEEKQLTVLPATGLYLIKVYY